MKLLVSAFEPFGKRKCNTSADLLAELQKKPARTGFSSQRFVMLPVNFRKAWPVLRQHIAAYRPQAALLLGEKTGSSLTLETTARNIRISRRGLITIAKNSPMKITSPFPVKKIGTAVRKRANSGKNILIVGNDAGTYLCNFIYFKMLSSRTDIPALFVHVPALTKVDFDLRQEKYLRIIKNLTTELIKAIDGAGANYTSREN